MLQVNDLPQNNRPAHKLDLQETLDELVADGVVSQKDAERVMRRNVLKGKGDTQHPFHVIAEARINRAEAPFDLVTVESLTSWLAGKAGLPYVKIDPLKVDVPAVTGLTSYAYTSRYKILPIEVDEEKVVIATADPYIREWEEELSRMLRRKIVRVVSNPSDISRYLIEFYALTEAVKRAFGKADGARMTGVLNLEQLIELSRSGKLDANDRYVVNIVDWLLQYAFDQRASDIHIEPRRGNGDVRFRIDGVLHQVYQLPSPVMTAVVSRLKVLGRMDLAEKRRPQDGRIKTKSPSHDEIELRLSTMPTAFGEKMVMRIFDPDVTVRSFEELGLTSHELALWKGMVSRPHGIILVTGPTGSGKTTTLYGTLRQLARPEVNVCTVEDPIEMVEPKFNQMQVMPLIGLDFANGLRNLLRQDPDIIMVGEIRDLETAEMAVQAALTGHLVFSTLHTNDAISAVVRLLDLGVPHYLIRATVLGVVAQRLVRTLCPACKTPGEVDGTLWEALVSPWKIKKPASVFHPCGCLECRETGYLGRMGLFEMLVMAPSIQAAIQADTDIANLQAQAIREGMLPLHISGAKKVAAGLTTIEEVFRVVGAKMDLG